MKNSHVKGQINIVGNDSTFNMNSMLINNISKSPYFMKCCQNLKDWSSVVDEIYYEVNHMQPWAIGAFSFFLHPICVIGSRPIFPWQLILFRAHYCLLIQVSYEPQ